ncbi:uncharacterized protein LOC126883727 [Diabrotica virgifera virgifera]|uniref:DNA-directed DNA polymerase n=1 Tax=Diabrotica virgifera virgifera TaxID=50390 RepID=A0ABM5K584_DIAVI|nr:uncharacterized protein LOC126883727 [Diabrotica virgifera virgifera]
MDIVKQCKNLLLFIKRIRKIVFDKFTAKDKEIWVKRLTKQIKTCNKERDSGFALNRIVSLEVNINRYEIGNGSSYIKLPESIQKKRACINVKNSDQACFYWAIVSALYPAKAHKELPSSYPWYSTVLKTEDLEAPMPLHQISKFEKLNNISVNVFALELIENNEKSFFTVYPARLTKTVVAKHVNLLLIQNHYFPKLNDYEAPPVDNDNSEIKYHYCHITDMSKLVAGQLNKRKAKLFLCNRCLNYFSTEGKLSEHEKMCADMNNCKMSFPKYDAVSFKNYTYKQTTPFVIYADFECMLEKVTDLQTSCCTKKYQKHIPYSAGYYVKCSYDEKLSFFKSYRGIDCMEWFANELPNLAQSIHSKIKKIIPMQENPSTKLSKKGDISLLPVNKEKYISFTLNDAVTNIKFRFIDSLRFLGASLDELVSTLNKNDFKICKREFSRLSDDEFKLITKKGVFCYDFIDSWEKLNITDLPPIEAFYNKLNDTNLTDEKYAHAKIVWDTFNIENLGQYSDLYLKTDIVLLADVFETFRKKCFITYGLDPAWYYTMPGYSWDCMLKYVGCNLELLRDVDMILFMEKAIRGGISVCSGRMSEANNKYMSNYDPAQPSKYLMYFDVNNLYGWAMGEPLPYGGFEWMDVKDIDVMSVPDDSPVGYMLQVDLDYPRQLHDLHSDFPFAAEHRKAQSAWLRPYIELNTRLRAAATNDFGRNLYKLANNSVFGKTMENIRKHRIVKLVRSWNGRYGAKNLISSARFHSRKIFNENLVAIELIKSDLVFNKPLYIGMTVLDISKLCMYQFHYDYMLPKLGADKCNLMYMDTDSFIYELYCHDAYEEVIKQDLSKFDTSDYAVDNIYNIPRVNKKVLGVMKDENKGEIMTKFVGLRSKMYTFKVQSGRITKKAKGTKYNIVKNVIKFDDYVNCLNDFKEQTATQHSIQSYSHNVYSIEQTKIALSPYDDKRYLIPNSFRTLPLGHYSILE